MPESPEAQVLRNQLTRWTAAGLIDAEQAERIAAAEAAGAAGAAEAEARASVAPARKKLPLVVEALGYLGTVIAIAAGAVALGQFWKNVPPAAELAFTAVAAVGLITAGAVLRTGAEPAFARLRGVLWLLATASVAGFAVVLGDSFLHLPPGDVAVVAAAAALACAIPLWWRNRSALQHVGLFASAVALAGSGVAWTIPNTQAWQVGLACWTLSALWRTAVYRGYLVPRTTGLAVACTGLLAGAFLTMDQAAGLALALLTVLALLSAGIALHKVLLMGFGAAGTIWVVPVTAVRYLPGSVSAPLAVAIVGLVLLGIALWLARGRRKRD